MQDLISKIRTHEKLENWEICEQLLSSELAKNENVSNVELYKILLRVYWKQSKFDQAYNLATDFLQDNPGSSETYLDLFYLCADLGFYEESEKWASAMKHLSRAKKDKNSKQILAKLYYEAADIRRATGFEEESFRLYKMANDLGHEMAFLKLGQVYVDLGQMSKAIYHLGSRTLTDHNNESLRTKTLEFYSKISIPESSGAALAYQSKDSALDQLSY